MMDTLKILTKARALLALPEHWCQGAIETTRQTTCGIIRAYCAAGAVRRVAGAVGWSNNHPALVALAAVAPLDEERCHAILGTHGIDAIWTVVGFNDWCRTDHAAVLAWFDRAIEAERAQLAARAQVDALMVDLAELLRQEPVQPAGGTDAVEEMSVPPVPIAIPVAIVSLADIEDEARERKRELEPA